MEKTVIMTGKQYVDLKNKLEQRQEARLNIGTDSEPRTVTLEEVYIDSDPDFSADPDKYPKIDDDAEIQVRIKFSESAI